MAEPVKRTVLEFGWRTYAEIHASWCGCEKCAPMPLAGHRGDCPKVLLATVTGKTDVACGCEVSR